MPPDLWSAQRAWAMTQNNLGTAQSLLNEAAGLAKSEYRHIED
jgi:hypothetical protein